MQQLLDAMSIAIVLGNYWFGMVSGVVFTLGVQAILRKRGNI
jgi:hypothetical protein